MKKLTVIHGPNINLVGTREPGIYGNVTLEMINNKLLELSKSIDLSQTIELDIFQSNHEGALVDYIQKSKNAHGIIINAGAYTHTSIAIRDALLSIQVPFIEVHLSNVHARESFRTTSYLSDKAIAVITGLREYSYYAALRYFIEK